MLTDGSINLTIVGLLASHLTAENHLSLLEQARRKSKRDVELLLASLRPRPDVPSSVRTIPNGDVAAIFDRALTLLLNDLSRKKLAWTTRPQPARKSRSRSRRIPAAVKREVWARDGGQCAFVGAHGRCTETGFLEFHHVVPYAAGGQTLSDNLELRCKAHNMYEAELYFGPSPPLVMSEGGPSVCHRFSTRSGPS